MNNRIETGPLQFDDDWPGVFIRGDNALFYAGAIDRALAELAESGIGDVITCSVLKGLAKTLHSCHVNQCMEELGHSGKPTQLQKIAR